MYADDSFISVLVRWVGLEYINGRDYRHKPVYFWLNLTYLRTF